MCDDIIALMITFCLIFREGSAGGGGGSKCCHHCHVMAYILVDRNKQTCPPACCGLTLADYVAPFVMASAIDNHRAGFSKICRGLSWQEGSTHTRKQLDGKQKKNSTVYIKIL